MMLMIPAGYRDNKMTEADFKPELKDMEAMGRFNEELGKAFKILSLNGLQSPQRRSARFVPRRQARGDRRAVHRGEGSAGRLLDARGRLQRRTREVAQRCPALKGDIIEIRQVFDCASLANKK